MIVESDGYRFDFQDALKAFKFDEKDPENPNFHGAPMKAVDVVAEFREAYIFVEIKEYDPAKKEKITICADCDYFGISDRKTPFNRLKDYLKYKYRDSYLYRHAEGLVEKPIHYLCLINFDNALNGKMADTLGRELPVGIVTPRWKRELASSCAVLTLAAWNRNFPKWPVNRL